MILKIEITKACNQSCLHCPYSSRFNQSQKHLTLSELQKYVTDLRAAHRLPLKFSVLITGGEPLLNPELFPMIDYLRTFGAKNISLASNGLALINNLHLQAQLNKIDELIISLSSSTKEYYQLRNQDMNQVLSTLARIKADFPNLTITGNYLAHSQNLTALLDLTEKIDSLVFHHVRFLTYESMLAPKSSPLANLSKSQLVQLTTTVNWHNRQLTSPLNLIKRLLGLSSAQKVGITLVPFERDGQYENSKDVYLSAV